MPRTPKAEPYFLAYLALALCIAGLIAMGVGLSLHGLGEIIRALVP